MTITRGLAAGAMFAGLALVVDGSRVHRGPAERPLHRDRDLPGRSPGAQTTGSSPPAVTGARRSTDLGQANLVNGQWTLDGKGGVSCEEGGDVHDAIGFHYTWDPNTLDGTVQITNNVEACGNPQGYQETNKLHLQLAP